MFPHTLSYTEDRKKSVLLCTYLRILVGFVKVHMTAYPHAFAHIYMRLLHAFAVACLSRLPARTISSWFHSRLCCNTFAVPRRFLDAHAMTQCWWDLNFNRRKCTFEIPWSVSVRYFPVQERPQCTATLCAILFVSHSMKRSCICCDHIWPLLLHMFAWMLCRIFVHNVLDHIYKVPLIRHECADLLWTLQTDT